MRGFEGGAGIGLLPTGSRILVEFVSDWLLSTPGVTLVALAVVTCLSLMDTDDDAALFLPVLILFGFFFLTILGVAGCFSSTPGDSGVTLLSSTAKVTFRLPLLFDSGDCTELFLQESVAFPAP